MDYHTTIYHDQVQVYLGTSFQTVMHRHTSPYILTGTVASTLAIVSNTFQVRKGSVRGQLPFITLLQCPN